MYRYVAFIYVFNNVLMLNLLEVYLQYTFQKIVLFLILLYITTLLLFLEKHNNEYEYLRRSKKF